MNANEFKQIFPLLADNARKAMGGLFASDPQPLTKEDCVEILMRSFS